jgi:hypothetical protein
MAVIASNCFDDPLGDQKSVAMKREYDDEEGGRDVIWRGFKIIETFRPLNPWQSISQIADLTAMPRSTVGRLVGTLIGAHYLETSKQNGLMRLSDRALALTLRDLPASDVMLLISDWFQKVVDGTSGELRIYKHDKEGTRRLEVLRSLSRAPDFIECETPLEGIEELTRVTLRTQTRWAIGDAQVSGGCSMAAGEADATLSQNMADELVRRGFFIKLVVPQSDFKVIHMKSFNAVYTSLYLDGTKEVYVFELIGSGREMTERALRYELGPALASARRRVAAEVGRFRTPEPETGIQLRIVPYTAKQRLHL